MARVYGSCGGGDRRGTAENFGRISAGACDLGEEAAEWKGGVGEWRETERESVPCTIMLCTGSESATTARDIFLASCDGALRDWCLLWRLQSCDAAMERCTRFLIQD